MSTTDEKTTTSKAYCENCGHQIEADAETCPNPKCGKKLTNRVKPEQVGRLNPPFSGLDT